MGVQVNSFSYRYLTTPAVIVEKTHISLLDSLHTIVENQLMINVFIFGLSILFH